MSMGRFRKKEPDCGSVGALRTRRRHFLPGYRLATEVNGGCDQVVRRHAEHGR